ncbi:MAG: hypothetical protein Q6373_011285 [Candidatus Sigynarchaeota archaeon]
MTEPYISSPGRKKKVKSFKDQADTIFGLVYVLAVIVCSIPTWMEVFSSPDARIGIAFMKFTALFAVLARPFSLMVDMGNSTSQLLGVVFPNDNGWILTLQAKYPEITDFNSMFQTYIGVPDFLFLVPFVFLVLALVFLGYKTPPERNVIAEGIKFALNHYLGTLAGFSIFWGISGMILGLWDFGFVLAGLFTAWGTYWVDLLLWIGIAVFLVAVGNFAAGKRPAAGKEAAEYLVSSLQQPTPRAFPVQPRAAVPPASTVLAAQEASIAAPVIAPTVLRKYCEYCGSKIETGARYCPGCGVNLEIPAISPPAQVTAPPRMEVIIPAPRRPAPAPPAESEPMAEPAPAPPVPAKIVQKTPGQKRLSSKEIAELERALIKIDGVSQQFAMLMMAVGVIVGVLGMLGGNLAGFASALLSLPMGILMLLKDRDVFTKWVFERNYTSRGVDMILWGIMGSFCSGAGLLVLVKGIIMVVLTQNLPAQYPTLSNQQWRARVFQASTTLAGTWTLLVTIANLSRLFNPDPLSIAFGVITTFIGFAAYFVYTRFVRPEIIQGKINDMDAPLIIAGACSIITGGAGILLLVQGILIAIQKDERKRPEELIKDEAEQSTPKEEPAARVDDEKPFSEH